MALKNQNNKNFKGASLIRKPQLKGKQNKKNQKNPTKPWNKFSGKRDTSVFNTKFFHNVSQPR